MSIKKFFIAILLIANAEAFSQSVEANVCKTSKPKSTPYGELSRTECKSVGKEYKESINVNGVAVLVDAHLYEDASNKDRSIRIYTSGASNVETGCAPRLYLLDLSMRPIKVIAFGVNNACNQFQWASWGAKHSVIALKNNVKFTYHQGKMILPSKGAALFKSIEPPHSSVGVGLTEVNAVPFAQDFLVSK